MELLNPTPFVMDRAVFWDRSGAEQIVMALKGTWDIKPDGSLSLSEQQAPINMVEQFLGEPDSSSITLEAELGPIKPATDIFLTGSAKATIPGTRVMDIRLKVGNLGRTARVFGPRVWKRRLGMHRISDPDPFESVPLIWENAFGGTDLSPSKEKHHSWLAENPVGCGYLAKHSKLDWLGQPLPCIENPQDLLTSPKQKSKPVGFGPIARHWQPRVNFAGTYDDRWTEERMPLLPDDFQDQFHNAAPAGLVAESYLKGGQEIEIFGCTTEGKLHFPLPEINAFGLITVGEEALVTDLALNTVTIDSDALQLRLLWKGAIEVHGRLNQIQQVECSIEGEMP